MAMASASREIIATLLRLGGGDEGSGTALQPRWPRCHRSQPAFQVPPQAVGRQSVLKQLKCLHREGLRSAGPATRVIDVSLELELPGEDVTTIFRASLKEAHLSGKHVLQYKQSMCEVTLVGVSFSFHGKQCVSMCKKTKSILHLALSLMTFDDGLPSMLQLACRSIFCRPCRCSQHLLEPASRESLQDR